MEDIKFETMIKTEHLDLSYGDAHVLKDISFDIGRNMATAFIGPSGCGKSSYLRCLNRMNDFVSTARVTGSIVINGENILSP
ncbi:MAG: ATP-binding cassette domain-containing protein, partial [Synergistaceae bacterium]|nr:ATP-binding cassette domain-containing protein [Synergistaceae bacterium]